MAQESEAAALLRDLVNTFEPQTDEETWRSPADLQAWFADHGLLSTRSRLTGGDLERAHAVREGLRAVLLGHAGHQVDRAALERMQRAIGTTAHVRLDASGLVTTTGSPRPFDHAMAGVLEAVRRSEMDGSWQRLKVCERETCHWAYFDASRNRSRRWCSMEGCGNVLKMRRRAEAVRG